MSEIRWIIEPPEFLADTALRAVLAALPEARLVGGCVRDAIAGVPVADVDLATPRPPDQVMQALATASLRSAPTGIAHGTVTAISGGRGFEITTLRRDLRTDGRHAEVAFTDDWREDAARRDFTINAMSMTPAGEVFDYFGGRQDLAAGRVRFVGDPAKRLAEDRLRALRFFRFFARYADTASDEPTLSALRDCAPGLTALSSERVWGEIKRILEAPDPRRAIALMGALGVLQAVLPEAGDGAGLERLVVAGGPTDPLLRLAALLGTAAASPAARLRLSSVESTRLAALREPGTPRLNDDDATLRRLLADTPADILIGRSWLAGAPADLRERLTTLPRPVFPLQGRDGVAAGLPPGPRIGAALAEVRGWWLAGGCVADRESCLAQLRQRCGAGLPHDQR